MLAYLYDETLGKELNVGRQNYWDVYLGEILNQAGFTAEILNLQHVENETTLDRYKVLLIGRQSGTRLSPQAKQLLERWVERGGGLVGFGAVGLENIFGYMPTGTIIRQRDDFGINGYFRWEPHRLVKEVHPLLFLENNRLVFSDIVHALPGQAEILARFRDATGVALSCPAALWRTFGKGYAAWFAFDVAKTVWILHQGRPVWDIEPETKDKPRSVDLQVLGGHSRKIMYADELVLAIQSLIAQSGIPAIYPLPPTQGKIPDALLYWGGDEYHGPTEYSLKGSDFMKSVGLPYHINLEPENHPMTKEEFEHITKTNGHEISIYYTLYQPTTDGKFIAVAPLTKEKFVRQNEAFRKRFGYRPGTSVNHCIRWSGWVEPAKWIEAVKGKADNSFGTATAYKPDPWGNAAAFGSGFGTCFPFFFYDDYSGGNRRINVIEQPINCYEFGHRNTVRGSAGDPGLIGHEEIHLALDLALKYHAVMNMFYHPYMVGCFPSVQEAIREILRYLDYRKAIVRHMGNDALADWWFAKTESTITNLRLEEGRCTFETDCRYEDGIIVKIPWLKSESPPSQCFCDGKPSTLEAKEEFGLQWLYLIVPSGKHRIEINAGKRS